MAITANALNNLLEIFIVRSVMNEKINFIATSYFECIFHITTYMSNNWTFLKGIKICIHLNLFLL